MRTPAQIAASRANGAKSKGPVTAQGKCNSSRNSIRHGLLADTIVLEEEKKDEFFALLNELFDEHQPATPTEIMMVETIAAARWRQDRIWGMQKVAFDQDVSSSPDPSAIPPLRAVLSLQSSPEKIRSHELLLRYDIAFDRQISRALLRLQQLQERNRRLQSPTELINDAPANAEPVNKNEPNPQPATTPQPKPPTGAPQKSAPSERTQQPIEIKRTPSPVPAPKPATPLRSTTLQKTDLE